MTEQIGKVDSHPCILETIAIETPHCCLLSVVEQLDFESIAARVQRAVQAPNWLNKACAFMIQQGQDAKYARGE